jgi:hypothetical protein
MPFISHIRDRTKDTNDGKTRKKAYASIGRSEGKERLLEIERESTSSHFVENSLWMRLWTCRKTAYGMNELLFFSRYASQLIWVKHL